MTKKRGELINRDYLLQGSPASSATYVENIPRHTVSSAAVVIGATGIMTSVAVPLQAGDIVTNITFRSGTTAANTPLNWWFALYSSASTPALLAQTADQTTTAWAASTTKTLALATPQTITTTGIYYAALCMVATAQITCAGMILPHLDLSTGLLTTEKALSQSSGSSLTSTAPATIATPTKLVGVPYVVLT
jgi:hypothetical protein